MSQDVIASDLTHFPTNGSVFPTALRNSKSP